MLNALEVAGQVLDLPALLRARSLFAPRPQHGQARSFRAQLVDLRADRQVLEVGQRAPSPAPLHPPPLAAGSLAAATSSGWTGFLLQFFAEVQQRLRQLAARFQPVRPRPVVPLLVALQLQLQTQRLHVEIVGALPLLRAARCSARSRSASAARNSAFNAAGSSGRRYVVSEAGTLN